MKVKWIIDDDYEDGLFNGEDLLGDIFIERSNEKISSKIIILDGFITRLVQGFIRMDLGEKEFSIEVLNEPGYLIFKVYNNEIFSFEYDYEESIISNININEYFLTIYLSSKKLLELISKEAPKEHFYEIEGIQNFLNDYEGKYEELLPLYEINEESLNTNIYSVEVK